MYPDHRRPITSLGSFFYFFLFFLFSRFNFTFLLCVCVCVPVCLFIQKISLHLLFTYLFIDYPSPSFFSFLFLKSWEASDSWRPDVIRFAGIFYFGARAKEPGPKIPHDYRSLFKPCGILRFFGLSVLFEILANIKYERKKFKRTRSHIQKGNITTLQYPRGRIFRTEYSPSVSFQVAQIEFTDLQHLCAFSDVPSEPGFHWHFA